MGIATFFTNLVMGKKPVLTKANIAERLEASNKIFRPKAFIFEEDLVKLRGPSNRNVPR